jgi:hypothetical protein
MSYSISNVLVEAGTENIMRWIPYEADEKTLRNRIRNKMIRPTTIPATLDDLKMEHAVAREALRLALEQHRSMAVGLKGVQQERSIADAFSQSVSGQTLVNMMSLSMIVGSGGALSHSPRRIQSAMLMLDAFLPQGITRLAVDSIFMMPHLGVLTEVNEKAAEEVFEKDCLIPLGTAISPVGEAKSGAKCMKVVFKPEKGKEQTLELTFGDIKRLPLGIDEKATVELYPERGFDLGQGSGKSVTREISGGQVGVLIDCRGRPLVLPQDNSKRIQALKTWAESVEMYPA